MFIPIPDNAILLLFLTPFPSSKIVLIYSSLLDHVFLQQTHVLPVTPQRLLT